MAIISFIHTKNHHQVLRLQKTFGKNNLIEGSIHAAFIESRDENGKNKQGKVGKTLK
jgi:hypothetical protein